MNRCAHQPQVIRVKSKITGTSCNEDMQTLSCALPAYSNAVIISCKEGRPTTAPVTAQYSVPGIQLARRNAIVLSEDVAIIAAHSFLVFVTVGMDASLGRRRGRHHG